MVDALQEEEELDMMNRNRVGNDEAEVRTSAGSKT